MSGPSIVYLRRVGNAGPAANARAHNPDFGSLSVVEQQRLIDAERGPFSAPITAHLDHLGWSTSDLILGVPTIREAWIREHGPLPEVRGVDSPDLRLAIGEILRKRPDVVLDLNLSALGRDTAAFLRQSLPNVRVLAGRMGTTKRYHQALHLDLSLVPCDRIADAIRPFMRGTVKVLPHSFDTASIDDLPPRHVEIPLVFASALGPRYQKRHAVLMALLESTDTEAWIGLRKDVSRTKGGQLSFGHQRPGRADSVFDMMPTRLLAVGARRSQRFAEPFNRRLAERSGGTTKYPVLLEDPRHRFPDRCHGMVSGREYLDLTRRAGVVVHREGDDLDGCGGALRLFEVTGVGAALLVDDSPMVRRLFEPGEEVVTYRSPEEAVAKARWLTEHPEERERIAAAGQARTLRDHSTARRAAQLDGLLREALDHAAGRGRSAGRGR